uniref:Uncharacterized protein n=1 Tax=Chromera velia CCMP2878 TaxID=1169474 RepID=A0A0G4H5D1_9ALVE|eukprot:Cvel_24749.t1-p1 / transcript=Cvel_24749.t1 / gene=Cvel_24749 / organism=Chromera_velia_CCMP2878 / gene_product=hypothetical protein / transcript_product=hypothetical protein / location=Cvel_scaffold2719:7269-17600(+) / protein_length=1322 / sequence_SO=supercontig / SO=protein_coding / is_pseudo=false
MELPQNDVNASVSLLNDEEAAYDDGIRRGKSPPASARPASASGPRPSQQREPRDVFMPGARGGMGPSNKLRPSSVGGSRVRPPANIKHGIPLLGPFPSPPLNHRGGERERDLSPTRRSNVTTNQNFPEFDADRFKSEVQVLRKELNEVSGAFSKSSHKSRVLQNEVHHLLLLIKELLCRWWAQQPPPQRPRSGDIQELVDQHRALLAQGQQGNAERGNMSSRSRPASPTERGGMPVGVDFDWTNEENEYLSTRREPLPTAALYEAPSPGTHGRRTVDPPPGSLLQKVLKDLTRLGRQFNLFKIGQRSSDEQEEVIAKLKREASYTTNIELRVQLQLYREEVKRLCALASKGEESEHRLVEAREVSQQQRDVIRTFEFKEALGKMEALRSLLEKERAEVARARSETAEVLKERDAIARSQRELEEDRKRLQGEKAQIGGKLSELEGQLTDAVRRASVAEETIVGQGRSLQAEAEALRAELEGERSRVAQMEGSRLREEEERRREREERERREQEEAEEKEKAKGELASPAPVEGEVGPSNLEAMAVSCLQDELTEMEKIVTDLREKRDALVVELEEIKKMEAETESKKIEEMKQSLSAVPVPAPADPQQEEKLRKADAEAAKLREEVDKQQKEIQKELEASQQEQRRLERLLAEKEEEILRRRMEAEQARRDSQMSTRRRSSVQMAVASALCWSHEVVLEESPDAHAAQKRERRQSVNKWFGLDEQVPADGSHVPSDFFKEIQGDSEIPPPADPARSSSMRGDLEIPDWVKEIPKKTETAPALLVLKVVATSGSVSPVSFPFLPQSEAAPSKEPPDPDDTAVDEEDVAVQLHFRPSWARSDSDSVGPNFFLRQAPEANPQSAVAGVTASGNTAMSPAAAEAAAKKPWGPLLYHGVLRAGLHPMQAKEAFRHLADSTVEVVLADRRPKKPSGGTGKGGNEELEQPVWKGRVTLRELLGSGLQSLCEPSVWPEKEKKGAKNPKDSSDSPTATGPALAKTGNIRGGGSTEEDVQDQELEASALSTRCVRLPKKRLFVGGKAVKDKTKEKVPESRLPTVTIAAFLLRFRHRDPSVSVSQDIKGLMKHPKAQRKVLETWDEWMHTVVIRDPKRFGNTKVTPLRLLPPKGQPLICGFRIECNRLVFPLDEDTHSGSSSSSSSASREAYSALRNQNVVLQYFGSSRVQSRRVRTFAPSTSQPDCLVLHLEARESATNQCSKALVTRLPHFLGEEDKRPLMWIKVKRERKEGSSDDDQPSCSSSSSPSSSSLCLFSPAIRMESSVRDGKHHVPMRVARGSSSSSSSSASSGGLSDVEVLLELHLEPVWEFD